MLEEITDKWKPHIKKLILIQVQYYMVLIYFSKQHLPSGIFINASKQFKFIMTNKSSIVL